MNKYLMLVLTVLTMLFQAPAFAADDASVMIGQHQALAAQYEAKADEQNAIINEHTAMTKEYDRRYGWMTVKGGGNQDVKDMDKHCKAIVQNATGLKNSLLEFANFHRMRASEAKGL